MTDKEPFLSIYKCTKCGWLCNAKTKGAIGTAHSHAEKHAHLLGIFPAWLLPSANPRRLDKYIEHITIEEKRR